MTYTLREAPIRQSDETASGGKLSPYAPWELPLFGQS